MTPSWVPEPGWTGDWTLPEVLQRPVSEEDRRRLLALSCGGLGPRALVRRLEELGSVEAVADDHTFTWDPTPRMRRVEELGARVVLPCDVEYPEGLRSVAAPPPLLYVLGQSLGEPAPGVAIVGSRACTRGGRIFARRLGTALARAGFAVVSGLARGIDGSAHTGALDAGCTVAVLGTGIERVYPAEHRELADRIVERGSLVTEFPPGTTPRPWHFPARNRIITGLAIAVIVVEAAERSGALITAQYALDHGRSVYACITGPENPSGGGVRSMLRDGAELIVDAEDAVERLRDLATSQGFELPDTSVPGYSVRKLEIAEGCAAVYEAVTEGTTVEEITELTGLSVSEVAVALGVLELDGLLAQSDHGWYRASQEMV